MMLIIFILVFVLHAHQHCSRRHMLTSHALQRMRAHVHHRRRDRQTLTNTNCFFFMRDRQTALTERLLGLSKLVADVIVKQSYEVREHRSCSKDSRSQTTRHPASLRCTNRAAGHGMQHMRSR